MNEAVLRGEELLEVLNELRQRLNSSGVERTTGLKEAMGHDCPFYWKSLNLFIGKDYNDLMDLILRAAKLFDQTEEENLLNE